jgi:hypothetical protein
MLMEANSEVTEVHQGYATPPLIPQALITPDVLLSARLPLTNTYTGPALP